MPAPIPADPLDYSDKYNTPIPPEKQKDFDSWAAKEKAKTGRDPRGDRYDYDVNGLFLSGQGTDERGHATDQFKKPNHPTFSNESIYHGKDGNSGGEWINQGGKSYYQPSMTNLKYRSPQQLQRYFKQYEPDTQLLGAPAVAGSPVPGTQRLGGLPAPPPAPLLR